MSFSRRAFLKLAGKAALAAPFASAMPACVLYRERRFEADTGLWLEAMAGDVSSGGAVVWVRAEPGSSVSIQYGKDVGLSSFAATAPIRVAADADYTARFVLDGLEPGAPYYYRAVVGGKKPGPPARFVTAPAPDDLKPVKFSFSGDQRETYKPFTIMDAIRAGKPDFFVHLGDTIYADRNRTASDLAEFWQKYRINRDDAPSQRLFSETSVYVIWDDHEVRDNYEPGHPLAPVGQRAFLDYWPIRRDPAEPTRIYRSFRWGKALDLFLIDGRQYRDRAAGTLLGARQKQWLFDGLAASSAIFKIVAIPVPLYGGGADRWDGYPQERAELIRWIRRNKIQGVLFISADLHFAAVAQVSRKFNVKEIVVGPMAAAINVLAIGYTTGMEFFANKTFNYGTITIDPKSSPPKMLVEIRDEANEVLYQTTIAAA